MENKAKMSAKVPVILIVIIALMLGIKYVYDNPEILSLNKKGNEEPNTEETLTDKYTIVTDYKYKTMQNDGGSNTSIYYEVDFGKRQISKIMEVHKANLTGEDTDDKKTMYTKNLDEVMFNELKTLITEAMNGEDTNPTNNYEPYVIEYNGEEKAIYNEDKIKEFAEELEKIDNDGERKLLFKVTSHSLKCVSPILYVYNDKTYEYEDQFSVNGSEVENKTGKYSYDVNKILDNIKEFEDQGMTYIIEDSEGVKHGFNSYSYLEEFLNELELKVTTCMSA